MYIKEKLDHVFLGNWEPLNNNMWDSNDCANFNALKRDAWKNRSGLSFYLDVVRKELMLEFSFFHFPIFLKALETAHVWS